jgi:hypothetical protein
VPVVALLNSGKYGVVWVVVAETDKLNQFNILALEKSTNCVKA